MAPVRANDGFEKCGFTALERAHQRNAPGAAGTSDVLSHCRLLVWSSAHDWVGGRMVRPSRDFGKRENFDAVHCEVHRGATTHRRHPSSCERCEPRRARPRAPYAAIHRFAALAEMARHLGMTAVLVSRPDTRPPSRGTICPRFACRSPSNKGAGNAGCALHPRSRVQRVERKAHTSIQGSGEHPTFPAQWFYGLWRAHPGEFMAFVASVASRKPARQPGRAAAPPQDLTPTSFRHRVHTLLPYAPAPLVNTS